MKSASPVPLHCRRARARRLLHPGAEGHRRRAGHPAQWPAEAAQGQVADVAAVGWRDFFTDRRLQQVIEQSLQNNRDLRVAVLNVERARGSTACSVRRPRARRGRDRADAAPGHRRRRQRAVHRRCWRGRVRAGPVRPRPQPQRSGAAAVLRRGRQPPQRAAEPGGRDRHRVADLWCRCAAAEDCRGHAEDLRGFCCAWPRHATNAVAAPP